ncbi:unnamed protein product [Bemisia tabaci]|uniref:Uncharacterized protein n=1 Tax=Bemisia tabaci TaxID=7038 RepID=A0A9P0CC02_BEMTA|nr:PREDICTED: uncharacterized protein LOC109034229 [Bemisia tabaci]CAH0767004.1 unnamed protein product [Bemisia tabaci]
MRISLDVVFILVTITLITALPTGSKQSGYISIRNSGDVLTSCSIVYNLNNRRFDDESGFLSKGDKKTIGLPGDGVRDLEVKCSYLKSGRNTKIFRQFVNEDEPVPVKICYDLWGDAANLRWKRIDCAMHSSSFSQPSTPFLSSTLPAPVNVRSVTV